MSPDHSVGNQVGGAVKRGIVRELMHGIAAALGRMLGGAAGRVARDAAWSGTSAVSHQVNTSTQYTERSRRDAVVQAFRSVQDKFAWDEQGKRFVAK